MGHYTGWPQGGVRATQVFAPPKPDLTACLGGGTTALRLSHATTVMRLCRIPASAPARYPPAGRTVLTECNRRGAENSAARIPAGDGGTVSRTATAAGSRGLFLRECARESSRSALAHAGEYSRCREKAAKSAAAGVVKAPEIGMPDGSAKTAPIAPPTRNTAAYGCYLRGRKSYYQYEPRDMYFATRLFSRAVDAGYGLPARQGRAGRTSTCTQPAAKPSASRPNGPARAAGRGGRASRGPDRRPRIRPNELLCPKDRI